MPLNKHRCDKDIAVEIPYLGSHKCSCNYSYVYGGSLLNHVFGISSFDYVKDFRICQYGMMKIKKKDVEVYQKLLSSTIEKPSPIVEPSPVVETDRISHKVALCSRLLDIILKKR